MFKRGWKSTCIWNFLNNLKNPHHTLITISTVTDPPLVLLYLIVLTEISLMLCFFGDDPPVKGGNFQLMSPFLARVLLSTLFSGASW